MPKWCDSLYIQFSYISTLAFAHRLPRLYEKEYFLLQFHKKHSSLIHPDIQTNPSSYSNSPTDNVPHQGLNMHIKISIDMLQP